MTSEDFKIDDEVAIVGKVKKVGGNFLIVEISQLPNFDTTEAIIFKEQAMKFKVPPMLTLLSYKLPAQREASMVHVDKFVSGALVRLLDNDGNISSCRWLQDVNDSAIQDHPAEVPNVTE